MWLVLKVCLESVHRMNCMQNGVTMATEKEREGRILVSCVGYNQYIDNMLTRKITSLEIRCNNMLTRKTSLEIRDVRTKQERKQERILNFLMQYVFMLWNGKRVVPGKQYMHVGHDHVPTKHDKERRNI